MLHFTKLAGTALAAATLLVGAANAQTVLRSSDTHPDGYPTVEAVKYFGDLIKERTDGRYSVEPNSARKPTRSSRCARASSTSIASRWRRGTAWCR